MAPVKVLTSSHLKGILLLLGYMCTFWGCFFPPESQHWKSEMTMETLLTAVPGLKDLDRDKVAQCSNKRTRIHLFQILQRENRLPLESPAMVVSPASTASGMQSASQTCPQRAITQPAVPSAPRANNSSCSHSLFNARQAPLPTQQTRKSMR